MQPIYLVKVDPQSNNNKYYKMTPKGDSFVVEYGRVGNAPQTDSYPISKWDTQLRSKLKKGYVDQTDLVADVTKKAGMMDSKKTFIKDDKSGKYLRGIFSLSLVDEDSATNYRWLYGLRLIIMLCANVKFKTRVRFSHRLIILHV